MISNYNPRILIADDDSGVLEVYCRVFEKNNSEECWRIQVVDQGEEAVAAVRASIKECDPFSAVFLDIRMPPGIDGCVTARQIRELDPNVHIVFVSGYSDYSDEHLRKVAGPSHKVSFLQKPFWPHQLKSEAQEICSDAQLVHFCRGFLSQQQ